MQSEVRATKETKPQGSVNKLVTPEMRQQIRQLKHGLDECCCAGHRSVLRSGVRFLLLPRRPGSLGLYPSVERLFMFEVDPVIARLLD